jgi:hypothetical protein
MFSVKSMCLAVELHLFHYCDLCPRFLGEGEEIEKSEQKRDLLCHARQSTL